MEEYKPLLLDGFDNCIVGIVERTTMKPVYCYDKEQIVKQLMDEEQLTFEQAIEHFEYNIAGAWMGEGTPCFITKRFGCCHVHDED